MSKLRLICIILSALFLSQLALGLNRTAYLLYLYERQTQASRLKERIITDLQYNVVELKTLLAEETSRRELAEETLKTLLARKETFIVTAYTHTAQAGVADINGTGDGITASGLPVREGLVAVDPRVIPLGTKIIVEGLGTLIAADTGGAIRGNRLDVFFESRTRALAFGRQHRWVIVLP